MNLLIEVPGVRRSPTILLVTVLAAMLLGPALDRYVSRMMQHALSSSNAQSNPSDGATGWDLRSMWY